MLFFRIIQHLLPSGEAWSTTIDKTLRRFFLGLSKVGDDAKQFVDFVYLDLFPETTRELAEWEEFYGIPPNDDDVIRRLALAAEWRSNGGQSKEYIEGVLRAAGFDVWLHEWWTDDPGPPWTARNPRDYTESALIGTVQCGEPLALCGEPSAQTNDFQVNESTYFANLNLSLTSQPPIPDHPDYWRFFLYVAGETFPEPASIPNSRKLEFQRLIQKLKPSQQWIVAIVDYVADAPMFTLTTEDGDALLTESGEVLLI